MATVVFYEKPGCGNNTKQKVWLAASGHTVLAKNILTERWTAERLRAFFGALPVPQWFNPAAPRVKSGEVDPAAYDAESALELMLQEPLFIKRPLLEVDGVLRAGFEARAVDEWIGLNDSQPKDEPCPFCHRSAPCPTPSPLLNPLKEQLANRLSPQAGKSLVIPQAGEEANERINF